MKTTIIDIPKRRIVFWDYFDGQNSSVGADSFYTLTPSDAVLLMKNILQHDYPDLKLDDFDVYIPLEYA